MLLEKKESAGKKIREKMVIGYDLGENYAQISCFVPGSGEPETLAVVTGTEQYNIPLVLCKRREVNQWFYGRDAVKHAAAGDGILVENLPALARAGKPVKVGDESFEPAALLTLFIKRSLSLLSMTASLQNLQGIMFTADNLDKKMVEVLAHTAANLNLKTEHIFFQSHVESFYYYTLNQPEELWSHGSVLFDYDNRRMKMYHLDMNRRTTPVVIFIDVEEYPDMERDISGKEEPDAFEKQELDRRFLEIVRKKCGGQSLSSAYLIGEGYKDEWASESLRYLCQGKRVFQGNNLYSKGACYAIREKLGTENEEKKYVFLGIDKLKANVGMKVLRRGIDSYYAIMDAGVNWFEAKREFDVILEEGNTLSIILTPLNGKEPREINMILEGLPERQKRTVRLHITVELAAEDQIKIKVRDLGFGELFPSSGGEWMRLFEV